MRAAACDAQAGDVVQPDHVIRARPVEQSADACRDQSAPRLLAHDEHAQLPVLQAAAVAGRPDVDPVVVVADEQKRRVEPCLLVVHGQGEAIVMKARERPQRRDHHREPLASAQPLLLQVAVDHHQRVKADRAVVDEGAPIDLGDVNHASLAGRNDLCGLVELHRNAKVAREMVECPEGQDSETGPGPRKRSGSSADRAVPAADDDQLGAGFRSLLRLLGDCGTIEQLDPSLDSRVRERSADFLGFALAARGGAARTVDADQDFAGASG